MESERPEPEATDAASTSTNGPTPEALSPEPQDLVNRLIAAGDWPEPALAEQILAAGEPVVDPLLDVMRSWLELGDKEHENTLYHGMGILGAIGSPAAIPVLVEIIREYPDDLGEEAARVLGDLGPLAFETVLEMVRDTEIKGYARRNAIQAARAAAGGDSTLRGRLAEVLRPMLADAMERTREEDRLNAAEPEEDSGDEPEGWTLEGHEQEEGIEDEELFEDEEDFEEESPSLVLEPYEEVMFLVGDLASIADAESRKLIKTAFAENLVDTFWIDEKYVEEVYRDGGEPNRPPLDWLEDYRERYRMHLDDLKHPRPALGPRLESSRATEEFEPAPPPQAPIRNTGPKIGRNDPCWCGSGKKYKKCHLGQDGRA